MFESQQRLQDSRAKLWYGDTRADVVTSLSTPQVTSDELLTQEVRTVTAYLCVVLVLSMVGNGTLGCVFYSKRQLLTVSNYFVLNMACCQLAMSLFVLPLSVVSLVHGKWAMSNVWCRGQSYLLVVVVVALHYTLLAISLDRNFAIVNSLRYPSVFTHVLGSGIVAGTWILGLLVGLPPLVGWGAFRFEQHQFLCSVDWQADIVYTIFFLVVVFLLPLLAHLWCYVSIFRAALHHTRRCSKCKAAKTIILIATAYFVCWTSHVVVALLKCWGVRVSPSMELSSVALVFLSCVLNPLIYGFLNRLTRFEIWKLWRRICRRALCRHPVPSFTSSDDALSSTWSTNLTPSRTSASLWVTPSQRVTRGSDRGVACSARMVEEMVTIHEERKVEEDIAKTTSHGRERDVITDSDVNNQKCAINERTGTSDSRALT
ncbi:hypothetical protein ACOMHN_011739 [Nucella lapillus]